MSNTLFIIYVGAFDPISYGHLSTANLTLQMLNAQTVFFIPNNISPVKNKVIKTPFASRCEMISLGIKDCPNFKLDTRSGLITAGPSYCIDNLVSFKHEFPDASLCLVVSSEVIPDIQTWDRFDEIQQLAHIAISNRHGALCEKSTLEIIDADDRETVSKILKKYHAGKIFLIHGNEEFNVSSTAIRHLISLGVTPRFMLPDSVLEFIKKHQLYE